MLGVFLGNPRSEGEKVEEDMITFIIKIFIFHFFIFSFLFYFYVSFYPLKF